MMPMLLWSRVSCVFQVLRRLCGLNSPGLAHYARSRPGGATGRKALCSSTRMHALAAQHYFDHVRAMRAPTVLGLVDPLVCVKCCTGCEVRTPWVSVMA